MKKLSCIETFRQHSKTVDPIWNENRIYAILTIIQRDDLHGHSGKINRILLTGGAGFPWIKSPC